MRASLTRADGLRSRVPALLAWAAAAAAALVVVAVYVASAAELMRYPWDWSPDEGLMLDYARRVVRDPASLYVQRAVPVPLVYGPLEPALLAPAATAARPFLVARATLLCFALMGAAAAAELARRRASPPWALVTAALFLLPFDLSFWHLILRVDGLLVTLWLWAAVLLLPRELAAGADALSTRRVAGGTVLLLAAVLVKSTAVLHAVPLVLGWWLVDRRSALRLTVALAAGGLGCLAALQGATHGGFLWVQALWTRHPRVPGQAAAVMTDFVGHTWPLLALLLAAAVTARAARASVRREPTLLLLAGGLAVVPLLGKHGSGWNYLLPFLAAVAVASAALFARAARSSRWPLGPPAILAAAGLALTLAWSRPFRLPSASDLATARAFYGAVGEVRRSSSGPLLATRPDLVYFLTGQAAEVEGGSFLNLAAAGAEGTADVLGRLERREYAAVIWTWPLPAGAEWTQALLSGYALVADCRLGYYYGAPFPTHLAVRRDVPVRFALPASARCEAAPRP